MYEAARLHDEIAHSNALTGFLVGAVLGIALVAAATVFFPFTGGLAACLLAGLMTGGAAVMGGWLASLGESVGRLFSSPPRARATSSPAAPRSMAVPPTSSSA
ncbi:type IV secretion protein Rhs, partial [Pseudomonas sp. JH-2]|nr:type IV secretion protein Rhs [Pseudomonas sp. JH-2]